MIYVICNVETGELLQVSTDPLTVSGHPLQVKIFDREFPVFGLDEWDRGGLRFVQRPGDRIITKLDYLRRFTGEERVMLRAAAKANPVLEDYMLLMELAEDINLDDPDTINAVLMLEQGGLIAAGRAAEILA